jgi:hypothetical protein
MRYRRPVLTCGQNGKTGGSACGGVPALSQPILQAQGSYSVGPGLNVAVYDIATRSPQLGNLGVKVPG